MHKSERCDRSFDFMHVSSPDLADPCPYCRQEFPFLGSILLRYLHYPLFLSLFFSTCPVLDFMFLFKFLLLSVCVCGAGRCDDYGSCQGFGVGDVIGCCVYLAPPTLGPLTVGGLVGQYIPPASANSMTHNGMPNSSGGSNNNNSSGGGSGEGGPPELAHLDASTSHVRFYVNGVDQVPTFVQGLESRWLSRELDTRVEEEKRRLMHCVLRASNIRVKTN